MQYLQISTAARTLLLDHFFRSQVTYKHNGHNIKYLMREQNKRTLLSSITHFPKKKPLLHILIYYNNSFFFLIIHLMCYKGSCLKFYIVLMKYWTKLFHVYLLQIVNLNFFPITGLMLEQCNPTAFLSAHSKNGKLIKAIDEIGGGKHLLNQCSMT